MTELTMTGWGLFAASERDGEELRQWFVDQFGDDLLTRCFQVDLGEGVAHLHCWVKPGPVVRAVDDLATEQITVPCKRLPPAGPWETAAKLSQGSIR